MKTTTIYACYLQGSTSPDYVGSHNTEPPQRSAAAQSRYSHNIYLGQGAWLDPETGRLSMPARNRSTRWGELLLKLSPDERRSIVVLTLEIVPLEQRCAAEARAIRAHLPPYNVCLKDGPDAKRAKWAAYQRGYRKAYLERNPAKLEAKRRADRERAAARRAEANSERGRENKGA